MQRIYWHLPELSLCQREFLHENTLCVLECVKKILTHWEHNGVSNYWNLFIAFYLFARAAFLLFVCYKFYKITQVHIMLQQNVQHKFSVQVESTENKGMWTENVRWIFCARIEGVHRVDENVQFYMMKCRFDWTWTKTNIYIYIRLSLPSFCTYNQRCITFGVLRVQCVMCNLVICACCTRFFSSLQRIQLPRKDN